MKGARDGDISCFANPYIPVYCRVINILLGKGYMELEETLLQWKQKNHLLDRLEVSLAPEFHCSFDFRW